MSILSDIKKEYKQTVTAYKNETDPEIKKRLCHDLVHLADLMESEQ